MSCRSCAHDDAAAFWGAVKSFKVERELADESHFHATVLLCSCGDRFVKVFTETIDWVNGEDPQYWTVMPVTAAEAAALAPGDGLEAALAALGPDRRSLRRDFPSNAEPRLCWGVGMALGPHD